MSPLRVSIQNALVCDDIRTEDTGKAILIGIYTGSINLKRMPTKLRLALWLIGKLEGSGPFKLALKITFTPNDGSTPFELKTDRPLEGEVHEPFDEHVQDFQVPIAFEQPIEFSGPGILTISTRVEPGQDGFVEVARKLVAPAPIS